MTTLCGSAAGSKSSCIKLEEYSRRARGATQSSRRLCPLPLSHNRRDETLELIRYINLKLAALGQPTSRSTADPELLEIAGPLLRNYHQKDQLLGNRLCPADTRVQSFLDSYLRDVSPNGAARLPVDSFVLDREGMARIMSLPASADVFHRRI